MNKQPDFDQLINRRGTHSIKWDRYGEDILPMWVADMDFRSPQPVIEALQKKVSHGIFGYPFIDDQTLETIKIWIQRAYHWKVNPEDIVLMPGVVTGLNLAAQTVSRPGESLLIQTPVYGPFHHVAENAGLRQLDSPLLYDKHTGYSIDFDHFRETLREDTRLFLLCNPQNPTGRVFDKNELEQIAQICMKNGTVICSDEIHCDLVYSNANHIPIASLSPEIAQQTITLIAPSKTFNIAGLKASIAIIPNKELREKFITAKRGLVGWINTLALTAMIAAYTNGDTWLESLLKYLEANRDYLEKYLRQNLPELAFVKPQGTYLAWLDCSSLGLDVPPSDFFLQQAKVAMNDGAWFGDNGKDFVRLNFGCPRKTLDRALGRIHEAVEVLRSGK